MWRRVVELFNILTSDGNGPQVARPLDGWSDAPIAQAILLIKHTPGVWRALDPVGRTKADWLMAAMAVLGNWGFNDANDWLTGIGLAGNFVKTNNPNFTQGYLGVMMACTLISVRRDATGCSPTSTITNTSRRSRPSTGRTS